MVDERSEHYHEKNCLVLDPGLWGLEVFLSLFVCLLVLQGRGKLIVDCKNASSVPVI